MGLSLISFEFILLCGIQIATITFALIILKGSVERYRNTDKSEKILRKSVKYFIFILITIICAGIWSLVVDFYFIFTSEGVVAGYMSGGVLICIFVNVFCVWQFLNYLLHPERRVTKYPLGIYVSIGIILVWIPDFYPGVMTSVFYTPLTENLFIYIYLFSLYFFVYGVVAFECLVHSYKSFEKKERYRFLLIGFSSLSSIFFFLFVFGLIYVWLVILNSVIFLYFGYNFPEFLQRALKIEE